LSFGFHEADIFSAKEALRKAVEEHPDAFGPPISFVGDVLEAYFSIPETVVTDTSPDEDLDCLPAVETDIETSTLIMAGVESPDIKLALHSSVDCDVEVVRVGRRRLIQRTPILGSEREILEIGHVGETPQLKTSLYHPFFTSRIAKIVLGLPDEPVAKVQPDK